MTNKLEQLKAAHAASTQGEWQEQSGTDLVDSSGGFVATSLAPESSVGIEQDYGNAKAIALAHNMMDDLLEAVELLEKALPFVDGYRRLMLGDGDITASNMRHVLARLKGEA